MQKSGKIEKKVADAHKGAVRIYLKKDRAIKVEFGWIPSYMW